MSSPAGGAAAPSSPPAPNPAGSPGGEASASPGRAEIRLSEAWAQQPIEPRSDEDSSFDFDIQSSTASLSASILDYRTIHGRTYHSEKAGNAEYWGPNDEKQNESQDIIHHLLTLVLDGKLFRTPLDEKKLHKVLDIGTGTGMWVIDFADLYPNVEVIGTDISPIQPSWIPPNVRFEIEDATQPWTFRADDFDFVHMRYLVGSIADWNELFAQVYRVLKPGGYVETFEADAMITSDDGTIAEGSPLDVWGKAFQEGGKRIGRTFLPVDEDVQRKGLEAAGFTNLVEWNFKCPLTGWPADKKLREMGEFSHLSMEQDLEGFILYMFKQVLGWSHVEIHAYLAHLRRQLRDKSVHPVFKIRCIYAQKPESAPAAES